MSDSKKMIGIIYPSFADYDELWPHFFLYDKRENDYQIEVSLTEEQARDYQEIYRKYWEWQSWIKENAFPNLEDY